MAQEKIRILWYGDSGTVNTGFGIVTQSIIERLAKTDKYHIIMVGINDRVINPQHPLRHNPNVLAIPIPDLNSDPYGYQVLPQAMHQYRPDVIIAMNDIWLLTGKETHQNLDWFYNTCKQVLPNSPIIIYFPVDGEPWKPKWIELCERVNRAVVYSDYGEKIVKKYGYKGKNLRKIYHGVDSGKFFPLTDEIKKQQRKEFGIPDDHYLIGIVARNQPRKNIPAAIRVMKMLKDGFVTCRYCRNIFPTDFSECPICYRDDRITARKDENASFEGIPNLSFYFHMHFEDRMGYDLHKVLVDEKLTNVAYNPRHSIAEGVPQEKLNMIYNSFDLMFLPTTAEGYGLPILECMAAGTPVVSTDCTSVSEMLDEEKGLLITPQDYIILQDAPNTRKFLINIRDSVIGIRDLLLDPERRKKIKINAIMYAMDRSWDRAADSFDELIQEVLNERVSIVDSFKSGQDREKFFFIREAGDAGDILCTLPAIRGVHERFPKAEIVYSIPEEFKPIIENIPYISNVIGIEHLWEGTRTERNNFAIGKFSLLGPESKYEQATMPFVDKSRTEIYIQSCGFKPKLIDLDYIIQTPEKEFARSLVEPKAGNDKKVMLKVDPPEVYKQWPEENWMRLASSLGRFKDLTSFIVTEDKSHQRWEDWYVKQEENIRNKIVLVNETEVGLRNIVATLNLMDLVVAVDSPIVHFAGALKKPILGLYGPIDYRTRLKHYSNAHVISLGAQFPRCLPCWRHSGHPCMVNNSLEVSQCMVEIKPGQVFAKIGQLLNPILSRAANKRRKEAFASVK